MVNEEDNFKPRNYQEVLREIAIQQNSIIYLPTGSGKTFIAVLVLKHLQRSSKKYTEGGKISFIVVNTVALVDQHAKCIEKRTNLKVGRYSGDMSLDYWPKSQWYEEFNKFEVFVMTIQILVNLTNQNFLDLNKVNLIVFDECHRGVSDQPMRQLCKSLKDVSNPPRILGLTATLLNGNCKPNKIMEEVEKLEITYHSQIATVDGLNDVIGYSTNPQERVITVKRHSATPIEQEAFSILEEIKAVLNLVIESKYPCNTSNSDLKPIIKEDRLKKVINMVTDIRINIETFGTYGGSKAILAHLIQIERLKTNCDDAGCHLLLCYVQSELLLINKKIDNVMKGYSELNKIFKFSSDKLLKLISIFDTYQHLSKEELCAIVFTKRRFTAKVIYYILDSLRKASEKYSYIRPNFMVGYNSNPFNDTREILFTSKKNKEVLQAFDSKEINVLASSNVLEEGVDITTCSLVIKFDYPEEYRSYIQSKGRARFPSSLYFMMVEEDQNAKFLTRYDEFQEVEKILQNFLIGKNTLRAKPSEHSINSMYEEDPLPPYYVDGPNSAKVDMVSAPSLLSSYCNSLPCDKYTTLTPILYKKEKVMSDGLKLVSVTIELPTASPIIEPITGPYMENIKLAKRAAALMACKVLHQNGELDDHLLPKKNKVEEEDISYLFSHYPAEKEPMAGTNKNKRRHQIQIPLFLRGPINAKSKVKLHIIELHPEFDRRDEINQSTFYDIYTSNCCYGLITPKTVPTICDFPIYVTLGTLKVSLRVNVSEISLTENDISDIKQFNVIIYNDVLKSLKEFLIFDNEENAESMVLVPVNKDRNAIDFSILKNYKNVKNTWNEPTTEEKLNIDVTQETFLRKIVSPWYKDMGDYLVTEVSLNKTAKSPFPNEQYASYEEYFFDKHNVRLVSPELPLLYVKSLTKKMNFIKPVGLQAKRKREKNYEELEIHLIPELVVKQEFPASLWIQANLLPTIISRLSFLFRLEEFRAKFAQETGIGQEKEMFKKPLELDEHLLSYEPNIEKPKSVNVLDNESEDIIQISSVSSINVNKVYAKSMLEMEYPWKDTDEPKDIERNLDVTILDIDYYETFMNKKINVSDVLLKNEVPQRQRQQLALTYFKNFKEKPIKLIEAKELNDGLDLCLLYKAMTTAKANDIVNMERLETLGDSFLKLFGSIYIYLKFPSFNEGMSTSLKGRLVSNKNLYYLAVKKKLGGLMKANDLQIADWLPPSFKIPDLVNERIESKEISLESIYSIFIPVEEQISGILSPETIQSILELKSNDDDFTEEDLINEVASFFKCNYIGDKNVADCVEALLGACFHKCGILGGLRFLEWMEIIPATEKFLELLNEEPKNPILSDKATLSDINYHLPDCQKIEDEILGYHFNNRAFLLQALTHASYTPNRITQSYEKLEFLGDAILDFLITCHIFETCGNLSPGDLTDLRSALVNNNTFASLVVRCNLHKYLLMINAKLQSLIDRFAEYIEAKKYEIDDEVLILLEEEDADGLNLAEYIDVPKVLGDIFEALAGAIYLDSGKDLKTVWKVFYRIMWKEIDTFSANVPKNLIRRLFEWMPNPHPKFGVPVEVEKGKVMVPLQFMLNDRKQQVYGFGSNKYMAKKAAAKLALRQLH